MKPPNLLLLIGLIGFLASCDKDDDPEEETPITGFTCPSGDYCLRQLASIDIGNRHRIRVNQVITQALFGAKI